MPSATDLEARFVADVEAAAATVAKLARLYARDPHEADDLRQEILLQAWRAYPRFAGESAFATWVYRVGVHVGLTWTRSRRRRDERETRFGASLTVTEAEPASPAAERLYAAIRALAPVDRTVISMSLDGYGHAEIAETLGVSAGAVATRASRIRARLRERLTPPT